MYVFLNIKMLLTQCLSYLSHYFYLILFGIFIPLLSTAIYIILGEGNTCMLYKYVLIIKCLFKSSYIIFNKV